MRKLIVRVGLLVATVTVAVFAPAWRVDADRLRTLAIDATWVGGRCVHGAMPGRPV